jgi:hypothetical protein
MENSYADGFTVGTGLKYVPTAIGTGMTLLARRHGGEAVPTAETLPTVYLCRRLTFWSGRNELCADGPDILPSAQDLAVGTLTGSRSE